MMNAVMMFVSSLRVRTVSHTSPPIFRRSVLFRRGKITSLNRSQMIAAGTLELPRCQSEVDRILRGFCLFNDLDCCSTLTLRIPNLCYRIPHSFVLREQSEEFPSCPSRYIYQRILLKPAHMSVYMQKQHPYSRSVLSGWL